MILLLYVLHYHFIRHVATAATEVPSRPYGTAPKLLFKVRKFLQQFISCLPFQPLQQTADSYLWRNAHEQMNMIARDVPFHYCHFVACTNFTNQVSDSEADLPCESGPTIFRCPDDMQMNLGNSVSATTIIFHGATLARLENLLNPSPKGEGFDPPRVRQ
jgi:hypothetical protein